MKNRCDDTDDKVLWKLTDKHRPMLNFPIRYVPDQFTLPY